MSEILTNFQWVDEVDQAINLIKQLKEGQAYAVDTEFERSRTFYLNPALLQIKCDGLIYLVDISIPELAKLVLQPVNRLILHSGSEDLELWHQVTGEKPVSVFDTQVAASLCGYSLHTSYLNLVKEIFHVELDKAMSRSDWLDRPLSNEQIKYAIEDILYLEDFKSVLTEKINEKGLNDLFAVLMKQMINNLDQDKHNERLFQKLVKAEHLKHDEVKKLWVLLIWRDEVAKKRNKPRNWILKPPQIIQIIKKVNHFSDLFHLGLHPNFVKYNGKSMIQSIHNFDESQLKNMPKLIKLNDQKGKHLSDMKNRLKQVCERFDLEPSIIINTNDLKQLAFNEGDLDDLPTWRALP